MTEKVSIESVVNASLNSILCDEQGRPAPYHPDRIDQWSNDTIELVCSTLQATPEFKSCKLIIHVLFCQSTGSGIHASTGAIWDNQHDFHTMVKYMNESVDCIVTVYCLAHPTPPSFDCLRLPTNH